MSKWRPNNKVTFTKWKDCAICGLPWPEDSLKLQRGLLVCPEDVDEPSHEDKMRESEEEPEENRSTVWEKEE